MKTSGARQNERRPLTRPGFGLIVAAYLSLVATGWVQRYAGYEIDVSFLYLIPVALVAWLCRQRAAFLFAALSLATSLVIGTVMASDWDVTAVTPYVNMVFRGAVFLAVIIIIGKLKQANSALADFANIVSHDLQAPVRQIAAYNDMLLRSNTACLEEKDKKHLARIAASTQRMRDLIADVLARAKTRAAPIQRVPVDLNRVLNDVMLDLDVTIEEASGTVKAHGLPTIQAAPKQMYQLFMNLVSNSLKYRKVSEPPIIDVTAKPAGENIEITFTDNSMGFDARRKEDIFAPFKRLNMDTSVEGTGLGLSICDDIVRQHGGLITAQSEKGVGSTFTIVLPVTE